MKPEKARFSTVVILVVALAWGCAFAAPPGMNFTMGPQPGDVYWEYTHIAKNPKNGKEWVICERYTWAKNFKIAVPTLKGATKAEISIEYWGGHYGTHEQRLVVNGHTDQPVYFPLPQNTPNDEPHCYMRVLRGNSAYPLPLSQLKVGENAFVFEHAPEVACGGKNYPNTWAYAAILRIYFDPSQKPHPTGEITSPKPGSTIGDKPTIAAKAQSANSTVKSVDLIAHYEDFDWEGNGLYRQWHYQTEKGKMAKHVGTRTRAPYAAMWNTTWIPDQDQPVKFMARITDGAGICYMTEAVENVTLQRKRSVRMCKASQVPKDFATRAGRNSGCLINLEGDVSKARAVKLVLSAWSGQGKSTDPGTIIRLEGKQLLQRFGSNHSPTFHQFDVPPGMIKRGKSKLLFTVLSTTHEHACEINWPGPVLMVEYAEASAIRKHATTLSANSNFRAFAGKGRIHFSFPGEAAFAARMVDLRGRVSLQGFFRGTGLKRMDTGRLGPGIYILELIGDEVTLARKTLMIP